MTLLKKYNNNKQLKASSLVESVIAMTIISVCILISLTVFSAVMTNKNSIIKQKINIEKNNILNQLKVISPDVDETFNFEGFSITKKIENFEDNNLLQLVTLTSIHLKDTLEQSYILKKEAIDNE